MGRALKLFAAMTLTAGCVTPYGEGQSALHQGRFAEAEGYFSQALAADPGRTDALVGLGIAQFKQGEIDQAGDTLQKALELRPNEPGVRLYLGLVYLQNRDSLRAEQQLSVLRSLTTDPRIARQIDRALEVIRQGPLGDPVLSFLVGSLETQAQLSRDAQEARLQAQRAQAYYFSYYPYAYPYFAAPFAPCVLVRRGGAWFCL
jgi:tetratricopeptide (TPR) repeat protein